MSTAPYRDPRDKEVADLRAENATLRAECERARKVIGTRRWGIVAGDSSEALGGLLFISWLFATIACALAGLTPGTCRGLALCLFWSVVYALAFVRRRENAYQRLKYERGDDRSAS